MIHPLTDPAQMVMIIAVILWVGMQPLNVVRKHVVIFIGSCLVGLAVGLTGLQDSATLLFGLVPKPPSAAIYQAILSTALTAAFLAAALPHKTGGVLTIAVIMAGLLSGYANIPDPGAVSAFTVTLAGSLFSIAYLVFVGSIQTETLLSKYDMPWVPIAIRTLCAWIAAISMLMLALPLAE